MASDEYEFVPTKDFEKLQSELQKIKQNPFLSKSESKDMKASIDTLHSSVDNLLDIFKQAHQELTQEERESRIFKKELAPITDKFERLEANQETIANGIVVVSDAVTKLTHKVNNIHSEFDKLHDMIGKVNRQVEKLGKDDSPSSGSRITRKYYTTRQFQQPNPLSSNNTPDISPMSPLTGGNNNYPSYGDYNSGSSDSVASSLQTAQMDASMSGTKPPIGGSSYYASPITTTVEGIPPPAGGMPPAPNSGSVPPPNAPSGQSNSSGSSNQQPQNHIPPMSNNEFGKSSSSDNKKSSGGFSLFKK